MKRGRGLDFVRALRARCVRERERARGRGGGERGVRFPRALVARACCGTWEIDVSSSDEKGRGLFPASQSASTRRSRASGAQRSLLGHAVGHGKSMFRHPMKRGEAYFLPSETLC